MFIKRKHACFQMQLYKKLFKKRNNSLKKYNLCLKKEKDTW